MSLTIEENIEEINRKMNFLIGIYAPKNPFELTAEQLQKAINELKEQNDKTELELKEIKTKNDEIEKEIEQTLSHSAFSKILSAVVEKNRIEKFTDEEIEVLRENEEIFLETFSKNVDDEKLDELKSFIDEVLKNAKQ